MIQRGQGKEGGRVLFGAGNVEVMGRLRDSSSNDMIETETNKQWIEENLGISEGQGLSESEWGLFTKKEEREVNGWGCMVRRNMHIYVNGWSDSSTLINRREGAIEGHPRVKGGTERNISWRFWRKWDLEKCFVMFGTMAPLSEWRPKWLSGVFFLLSKILIISHYSHILGLPCGSAGKESACNGGDLGQSLGWENTLEKGKATQSSILAWRIPWTV